MKTIKRVIFLAVCLPMLVSTMSIKAAATMDYEPVNCPRCGRQTAEYIGMERQYVGEVSYSCRHFNGGEGENHFADIFDKYQINQMWNCKDCGTVSQVYQEEFIFKRCTFLDK